MTDESDPRASEYEDHRRSAVLFNDISRAPIKHRMLFSDRVALHKYLWDQGWRRDVRPEDINTMKPEDRPDPEITP